MSRARSALRSSAGGARAARGFEFQAQVFAWFAARAVAGVSPGLGLGDEVVIEGVGSETGLPLDDVGVALSNGGFVLAQAKAGMREVARRAADLQQAVDQVVAALLHGIPTNAGVRPIEVQRDRLVIATSQDASRSFEELGKVCEAFPGLPAHLPLEQAARTLAQRHVLGTFLEVVRERWSAAARCTPSQAEIRRLLSVLQVMRLDFRERDGIDLLRSTEMLRVRAAAPLVDEPFSALVKIGQTTTGRQSWWSSEQLRQALRKRRSPAAGGGSLDWIHGLPQPYVERDELLIDATGVQSTTVISGAAGCGKTTLAIRLASDLAARFPDGRLMINMRGFADELPMSASEAVDLLLHQLGVSTTGEEEPPEARRLRLIKTLETGRFVVVLDNVAASRNVMPLLPRGNSSHVIITSRHTLSTLTRERDVRQVQVGCLTDAEATRLFTELVGRERVAAEPEAVNLLLSACGNLPLAISIAGTQIAQLPGQRLEQIAAGLSTNEDRLDFLDLGEPESSIRSVLSWSYKSLSEDQRRAYLLVGTAPGPGLDTQGVSALLGSTHVLGLLRPLRRLGLIQENSDGSFTMHDILRDFASSLANSGHLPHEVIVQARDRLLNHYARLLTDGERETNWLERNVDRALAAAQIGTGAQHRGFVRTIADNLIEPLWYRGRYNDAIALLDSIMDGFSDSTEKVLQAYFLRLLAISHRRAEDVDEAVRCARKALRLLGQDTSTASDRARADCRYIVGVAMAAKGDHRSALDSFLSALTGFESSGTESDVADVLNAIGWSLAMTGEREQALARCRDALAIHERHGPAQSLAADLDSIGYVLRLQGDHAGAGACFERCLGIYRDIGYKPHEARTLDELGETAAASGEFRAAALYWTQSIRLLEEIGLDSTKVRAKLEAVEQ